jgi:hypothetical protein
MFDVVIHPNDAFWAASDELRSSNPAITARHDLGPGLWVGSLDQPIAKAVMNFCDAICIGTPSPVTQYAQLYAFVRELSEGNFLGRWDEDDRLKDCVAVSRLVHPTGTGFHYAARVGITKEGLQICRAELSGINIEAHISPTEQRNWLTGSEATELKDLLAGLSIAQLPKRLSNALWYHEFAFRTWYADVRWTLVCTALEALLNTSPISNKKQFYIRASQLAAELGLALTEDDAKIAYDVRSKLAHGQAFLYGLPQAELRIYDHMEAVLRACIVRSIRDTRFAQVFATETDVAARWRV